MSFSSDLVYKVIDVLHVDECRELVRRAGVEEDSIQKHFNSAEEKYDLAKAWLDAKPGRTPEEFYQLAANLFEGRLPSLAEIKGKRPRMDHHNMLEQLQLQLREIAEEVTKIPALCETEKAIDPVSLQVMQGVNEVEFETDDERKQRWGLFEDPSEVHYERCQEFYEQTTKVDIKMDQLFKSAAESADKRQVFDGEAARKQRRCVSAVGQAGIGKTTLSKMLVREVLDKVLLLGVQFIFYLAVRAIDFASKVTFYEFLQLSVGLNPGVQYKWFRVIDQSSVLLVFDGLDEAGANLCELNYERGKKLDPDAKRSAGVWMLALFNGDLWPDAYKLITSRPRVLMNMCRNFAPAFIVKVLGLSKSSQESLAKQVAGEHFTEVWRLLKEQPGLSALCFVPVNCILTAHCLSEDIASGEVRSITTMTEVMLNCLQRMLIKIREENSDDRSQCCLSGISRLAYAGLISEPRRVVFSDSDIDEYGVSAATTKLFLDTKNSRLTRRVRIMDGGYGLGKTSNFSHLTWQEFFAALHLMVFADLRQFNRALKAHLKDGRLEVVLRFAFGICNGYSFARLKDFKFFLDAIQSDEVQRKKKEALLEMAGKLAEKSRNSIITISSWAYESADDEVTARLMRFFPERLILDGTFLPNDVSSFGRMLLKSPKLHRMEIRRVAKWRQDSLKRLLDDVTTAMLVNKSLKVDLLFLGDFPLTDEVVKRLPALIVGCQHLALQNCKISTFQIETVMESVRRRNDKLERLIITDQHIDEPGFKAIASGLHNAKRVGLRQTGMSTEGCLHVAEACGQLSEPLERLHLKRNQFGFKGVKDLSKCLGNIRTLILTVCELSAKDMEPLGKALEKLPLRNRMEKLELDCNPIGTQGAKYLAPGMGKVNELVLDDCDIGDDGIEMIAKVLAGQKDKEFMMNRLSLKYNSCGDEAASSLAKALTFVKSLEIDHCAVTTRGAQKLSKSLAKLKKPMELLSISNNRIESEGGKALLKCVGKMKKLEMSNCGVEGGRLFDKKNPFDKLKSPMESLDLSMNQICQEDASILFDNLQKVENLHLCQCDLKAGIVRKFNTRPQNSEQQCFVSGIKWQGKLDLSTIEK